MKHKYKLALISLLTCFAVLAAMFYPYPVKVEAVAGLVSMEVGNNVKLAPAVGEVIEERTENGKLHYLGDNKYRLVTSLGAVHYWLQDEMLPEGMWLDIDNTFTPAAAAPWDWQTLEAGYHIKVKEDFSSGQVLEFEKQGETIYLQPMALEWTNSLDQIQPIAMPQDVIPTVTSPEASGTIKWDDAYGTGLDYQWKCTSTRLLKILTVSGLLDLPPPQQYILDGGTPVLRLNLIFDPSASLDIYVDDALWDKKSKAATFQIIEFRKDAETLWGFMPLRYWDSYTGEEGRNQGQSIATLRKVGNSLYISIRVPYEWLQTAVYPIFIDADIDVSVAASTDDCLKTQAGGFSTNNASDIAGDAGGTDYEYGMRFLNIAIENADTIDAATFTGTVNAASSNQPRLSDIKGEDADDAATYSTEANYDARSLTTAGVTWNNTTAPIAVNDTLTSPEIKPIIQEIVDRPGWATGQDLALRHRSTGNNSWYRFPFYSWDGDNAKAPSLAIDFTGGATPSLTNAPATWNIGLVAINTDYWTTGIPAWPLDDGECNFTITNNTGGGNAIDVAIKIADFTGGVGWNIGAAAGANQVKMRAGKSGDANEAAMVVLTNANQAFLNALADTGTKKWELKLESSTSHTDGALKTGILTLTATLD